MGGQRTHRLLFVCLSVLLAGVMAAAVKVTPSPDRTRVASVDGPSSIEQALVPPPAPAPAAPPAARAERPIQPVEDVQVGNAVTATATAAADVGDVAVRLREQVVRAPTTEAAKTVFGLVIGINDYPGEAYDLRGAVADAEDMSDVFAMYGVPEANVRVLLDEAANTPAINDAFSWLVSSVQPDSTVVVFYAGHVRKLDNTTEAVLAADGAVLPDWYLAHQLQDLPAHNVWIVMAACYGGGFTELLEPGRMLTAAADANSLAYENDTFGRSYLDEYLIHRALLQRHSTAPTAQAAFAYAQAELRSDYPDRVMTQVDMTTESISLDGVQRDAPPPSAPDNPSQPGGGGPDSTVPPPSPPQQPPSCLPLLGILCPPGSR